MDPIQLSRETKETRISLTLDVYGTGHSQISTGVGFFDHMLTLFAFHGGFDLNIRCEGDVAVDDHHTVEDIGILLGTALLQSFPETRNFRRYGLSFLPMDEALARAVVDLSGRPFLVFNAEFERSLIGTFSTEMVEEFFRALADNAKMTLHLSVEYGRNTHHKIEALFKASGRALREALEIDPHRQGVASTKGVL